MCHHTLLRAGITHPKKSPKGWARSLILTRPAEVGHNKGLKKKMHIFFFLEVDFLLAEQSRWLCLRWERELLTPSPGIEWRKIQWANSPGWAPAPLLQPQQISPAHSAIRESLRSTASNSLLLN